MTIIILMRHAQADNTHLDGNTRPLTEEGKTEHQNLIETLCTRYRPTLIFASPKLRTEQTSQMLADVCGGQVQTEECLAAFDEQRLLQKLQQEQATHEQIACVGHMPSIAQFAEELVGERFLPTGLPPSGTAIIRFTEELQFGQGELVELITP